MLPSALDPDHPGVLKDADPQRLGSATQTPGEFGWVDHRSAIALPESSEIGGGVDFCPYPLLIKGLFACPRSKLRSLIGFGRHRQATSPLEVTCDSIPADCGLYLVEIASAQPVDSVEFCGE